MKFDALHMDLGLFHEGTSPPPKKKISDLTFALPPAYPDF